MNMIKSSSIKSSPIKSSPVMKIIILVLLFCATFIFVWMSSGAGLFTHQADATPYQPADSVDSHLDNMEQEIIFDTFSDHESHAHQVLLKQKAQSLDSIKKKADIIIAETEDLIKKHQLDQVEISPSEKQELTERQALLRQRLEDLKTP